MQKQQRRSSYAAKKCNPAKLPWQHGEDGQSGTQVGVCYTTAWSARTGSTPVKPSVSWLEDDQTSGWANALVGVKGKAK